MTTAFTKLITLTLALFVNGAVLHASEWMTDLELAKKHAQAENKDLLLEFKGSDWHPISQRLHSNVFSKPEFIQQAKQKFILVSLDYPKKNTLPLEQLATNNSLLAHYGIQRISTVLLCSAEGIPYARQRYRRGNPSEYMAALNTLLPIKEKFNQAVTLAKTLKGKEKAQALWSALDLLHEVPLSLSLEPILKSIISADPTDPDGKIEAVYIEADLHNLKQGDHYQEVFKRYDNYLAKINSTGIDKQRKLTKKINSHYQMKNFEGMRLVIDEIIAIDPDSRIGKGLKASKPRINMMEAAFKKKQTESNH